MTIVINVGEWIVAFFVIFGVVLPTGRWVVRKWDEHQEKKPRPPTKADLEFAETQAALQASTQWLGKRKVYNLSPGEREEYEVHMANFRRQRRAQSRSGPSKTDEWLDKHSK